MLKVFVVVSIVAVFGVQAGPADEFPQAEISNGLIQARLYLPDGNNGYYRASRFDWSGVMPELTCQGHSYFGKWFDQYSPTTHDAIMGPVEDFSPVGYDDAKTGSSFLKIGIGMLVKPEEPKYAIVTPYQLVNPGTWAIKKESDKIVFTHTLTDTQYAYQYKKTVQLVKEKPEMVLLHTLKNTGRRPIETNVYDHNFFVLDKQPAGPDFVVTFPFHLTGQADGAEGFGEIKDKQLIFLKALSKNEHLYYRSLEGFGNSAKDYAIRVENHKTGAGVSITSDQPLSKLVFWSAPATVCPEPYITLKVNPGGEVSWKIFYTFYTCAINK